MTVAVGAEGLSSVPQLPAGNPATDRERAPVPNFPGVELVEAAAALFPKCPRPARAARALEGDPEAPYRMGLEGRFRLGTDPLIEEGRAFVLTVSGGTVGVSMRDPARLERNKLTALGTDPRGTREVYAPAWVVEQSEEGPVYWSRDELEDGPEWREGRGARQISGWSRKSRARMVRTLAQLDWSPMYAEGRPGVMVTLTYPGDWLTVAPTGKAAKRHLRMLQKRYERTWGPLVGPWKLEFQDRGAPHFHLLIVAPVGLARCDCERCRCYCTIGYGEHTEACGAVPFREWLSHNWADVVAHPDPQEHARHRRAGTGVDYLRGGRCFDPKRAAIYFTKHGGAAGGKEYQHTVPVEWQGKNAGPGRFWGYWRLERVTADASLTLEQYVQLRRTLRRWSESKNLRRVVTVPRAGRVDAETGEVTVRYRRTTKPLRYVGQGGMNGGTVVVSQGPAFAAALARHPLVRDTQPVRALP